MKFSLATITLCALSMSSNTNAALFRGTARRELQAAQGFTTEQVTVDENTSTVGIPNCTPGQRVQFNNASGQWECFNPLGGVVVGQGTPTQDIPEDVVDDVSPTDSGATIIQPGGTTTVQAGPTSPSITTPEIVESTTTGMMMPNTAETVTVTSPPIPGFTPPQVPAPPDNSVAANGITTPSAGGSSGVVTTGLASCTSGQRAVFNAALQMWECDNNAGGGANVVTLNGNAVGGGNVVTVGTPNTSNQPAFAAAAAASGDDSKSKKDKKSKDDSNDGVAVNPATAGNAAMEGTVPTGVGCAVGQSSVYVPGEGEWRCVASSSARSSNPDMEP